MKKPAAFCDATGLELQREIYFLSCGLGSGFSGRWGW